MGALTRAVLFATLLLLLITGAFALGVAHAGPSPTTAPAEPVVTAAAFNTTVITVSWLAPAGPVVNYTLSYARFYGVQIAFFSVGTFTVFNVTELAPGLTYYFTVWAWSDSMTEGPPSNVAPAQTDSVPPVIPAFPLTTLEAITTLGILGSVAFSCAAAVWVAGRRSRRAEGAAAIALSRTRPRGDDREARTPRADPGGYRARPYVSPPRNRS